MKFSYDIKGMHCASCVTKIQTALTPHINVVQVSLNPPLLEIEANTTPNLNDLNSLIKTAGNYQLQVATTSTNKTKLSAYYPIFLIAAYIGGIAFINNVSFESGINWHGCMNQFMAGFFLVFSAFKLLDIQGFAQGYATYDLLAKRWYAYGYIYPFLELSLGLLYLTNALPFATQLATIIIMGFSSLGVINSLMKKQQFQCACLGTIIKVPLSTVTLIEDLLMVVMAAIFLVS